MRVISFIITAIMIGGAAMAIDEPGYTVISQNDDIEIREYEPYIVAETIITGDFEDAGSDAFRILFRFISGNNVSNEKIEMTAPVNQEPVESKGEKIDMTAPVVQEPVEDSPEKYMVGFVMPDKYTMDTVPKPKDERVSIRLVEARRVAVISYSGTWSEERYKEHEKKLFEHMKAKELTAAGKPVFARYNSPMIPWFMRRNEIIVPVMPQ